MTSYPVIGHSITADHFTNTSTLRPGVVPINRLLTVIKTGVERRSIVLNRFAPELISRPVLQNSGMKKLPKLLTANLDQWRARINSMNQIPYMFDFKEMSRYGRSHVLATMSQLCSLENTIYSFSNMLVGMPVPKNDSDIKLWIDRPFISRDVLRNLLESDSYVRCPSLPEIMLEKQMLRNSALDVKDKNCVELEKFVFELEAYAWLVSNVFVIRAAIKANKRRFDHDGFIDLVKMTVHHETDKRCIFCAIASFVGIQCSGSINRVGNVRFPTTYLTHKSIFVDQHHKRMAKNIPPSYDLIRYTSSGHPIYIDLAYSMHSLHDDMYGDMKLTSYQVYWFAIILERTSVVTGASLRSTTKDISLDSMRGRFNLSKFFDNRIAPALIDRDLWCLVPPTILYFYLGFNPSIEAFIAKYINLDHQGIGFNRWCKSIDFGILIGTFTNIGRAIYKVIRVQDEQKSTYKSLNRLFPNIAGRILANSNIEVSKSHTEMLLNMANMTPVPLRKMECFKVPFERYRIDLIQALDEASKLSRGQETSVNWILDAKSLPLKYDGVRSGRYKT